MLDVKHARAVSLPPFGFVDTETRQRAISYGVAQVDHGLSQTYDIVLLFCINSTPQCRGCKGGARRPPEAIARRADQRLSAQLGEPKYNENIRLKCR